ncbi:KRAB [Mytilus edulis]|uniref:KRAB n=1 Tax=Mytilus edulis TaxID=6550 RepID=A0A8S3S8F3_MYTED|nr:KRAB [Mytilus edulis]
MSSKSDFLSWDDSDLNLDLLLGDFTASDIESEDDYVPPAKTAKPQKEATTASANNSERQALYQCSDCDKTYSSVSGFRGHLRTKHSLSSIKDADDCAKQKRKQVEDNYDLMIHHCNRPCDIPHDWIGIYDTDPGKQCRVLCILNKQSGDKAFISGNW